MEKIRKRKGKRKGSIDNLVVENNECSAESINDSDIHNDAQQVKKIEKNNDSPTEAHKVNDEISSVITHETAESRCAYLHTTKNFKRFQINFQLDAVSVTLFVLAVCTRFYKLEEPRYIVFDELHYGKYVSLYMKNTFFFDLHPPFGKLLIGAVASLAGFNDNAILTQSRFILMEPMLLLFMLLGYIFLLKFQRHNSDIKSLHWWIYLCLSLTSLTLAMCVKYVGFFSLWLGAFLMWKDWWWLLPRKDLSDLSLALQGLARCICAIFVPIVVYVLVFYIHLSILTKAGPHDSVMTSAFQASLEGGLASITKGQPLEVAHGSQITLRHTHGKACWLHSHNEVYPIRYPDKRGSSHQQQVTCYTFKDLNNWWIVRRPGKNNLVVTSPPDSIKHGDIIQLVHGITGRALNSHDVSAPMSPHNQEVSCYIDYNISMPAQNLWKVDIINRENEGNVWHTIQSQVRLIHVNSSQALRYSGRQLPDWGFNQMEIVTDKNIIQDDTVWNVEEHRYTKFEDEKERERDMINAEMIPLKVTSLSFWRKFSELQYKMLFPSQENVQSHMYSSDPLEWPLMTRGIAYWVSSRHNGQVHLLGNIIIWYSSTFCMAAYFFLFIFYLLRRRRQCYDIETGEWNFFLHVGSFLFLGYLLHYIPYFFVDRTLFLHHYFPALLFKFLLTAAIVEHMYLLSRANRVVHQIFKLILLVWIISIVMVFRKFSVLSYGTIPLSAEDVLKLRWSDSWDFIIHKD
ncbi:hypothetical protein O3M35_005460 [Rhynocoris fuscipes]|uniref:Protein O-mannosyltransferase 1 n=1 Tax=Rhynocoris fuscipes TaxID=488301 RepID=A0AAW1DIR2_9HEMI